MAKSPSALRIRVSQLINQTIQLLIPHAKKKSVQTRKYKLRKTEHAAKRVNVETWHGCMTDVTTKIEKKNYDMKNVIVMQKVRRLFAYLIRTCGLGN